MVPIGRRDTLRNMLAAGNRLLLTLSLFSCLAITAQPYVRAGAAAESSRDVTLRDVDCSSTKPPALFGCGSGNDGRRLGARGEVHRGLTFELAAGREVGHARVELAFVSRSGFELDAQSNFTGVTGAQPVSARLRSKALVASAAFDLAPDTWSVRPFITAGAGAARNDLSAVKYSFPGIAANAVTITRGGRANAFTWTSGAGVAIRLPHNVTLDLAARVTDLGGVRAERGEALIERPTRLLHLEIGATEFRWRTRGVSVSLRRRF